MRSSTRSNSDMFKTSKHYTENIQLKSSCERVLDSLELQHISLCDTNKMWVTAKTATQG